MSLTDTEIETDLDYIKGELLNVQTELETYFGKGGSVLPGLVERIEGIEARVGELKSYFTGYYLGLAEWQQEIEDRLDDLRSTVYGPAAEDE